MNILDLPNTVLQKIVQNVRSVDAYISLYQFPQFKSIIDRTLLIQREARQNITGVPSVTQELYGVPVVEYIPQNKYKDRYLIVEYSRTTSNMFIQEEGYIILTIDRPFSFGYRNPSGVPLELFDSNRWPTDFWHNVLREEIYLPSHTKIICSIDVINRPYMHIGSYEEIRGMTARVDAPKLKQLVVSPQYGYAHILAKIQAPNLQFFHMGVNQRNFRNLERLNDFPKLQVLSLTFTDAPNCPPMKTICIDDLELRELKVFKLMVESTYSVDIANCSFPKLTMFQTKDKNPGIKSILNSIFGSSGSLKEFSINSSSPLNLWNLIVEGVQKLSITGLFPMKRGSEIDEIHTDRDLKELELSQASYLHQLTEIENLEKLTILTWHGPKWKLKKEYENVLKIFSILGAPWKLKFFTISVRVENSKIGDFVSQLNYLEEMLHDKPKRPLKYKVYPSGNKHMVYKLMFDVSKLVDRQPANQNIQFEPFENIFHRG